MKVSEVIEKLKTMDQDIEAKILITIYCDDGDEIDAFEEYYSIESIFYNSLEHIIVINGEDIHNGDEVYRE